MNLSLIVAFDQNYVIGNNNSIPWNFPKDLINFKKITTNNVCIMGRNTWESLPDRYKPLPNRINIVISSKYYKNNKLKDLGVLVFENTIDSIDFCKLHYSDKEVFIIGGSKLYEDSLNCKELNKMIITHIKYEYLGDVFFPKVEWKNWKVSKILDVNVDFDTIEYVKNS